MTIDAFAHKHRVKVKRDECQERVITGRLGHIFELGHGVFGLVLEALSCSNELDRKIKQRRRMAIAAGFDLGQAGDVEAILLFDPINAEQAKLAIRLAGVKPKRISSKAQLDVLTKARQARRISKTIAQRPQTTARSDEPVRYDHLDLPTSRRAS